MVSLWMGLLREYGRPARVVHRLGYHLVWCPTYRRGVLCGRVAQWLRELLGATCAERGWTVAALQVMPDHVHLVARCGPDTAPARLAHQLNGATSRTVRAQFGHLRARLPTLWSRLYFAASAGRGSAATTRRYVAEQATQPTTGAP
jgi:putative transposase